MVFSCAGRGMQSSFFTVLRPFFSSSISFRHLPFWSPLPFVLSPSSDAQLSSEHFRWQCVQHFSSIALPMPRYFFFVFGFCLALLCCRSLLVLGIGSFLLHGSFKHLGNLGSRLYTTCTYLNMLSFRQRLPGLFLQSRRLIPLLSSSWLIFLGGSTPACSLAGANC